jgi:hypothetical protein
MINDKNHIVKFNSDPERQTLELDRRKKCESVMSYGVMGSLQEIEQEVPNLRGVT